MYNNSNINTAITKTLNNMKANLTIIPKSLGVLGSEYRASIIDNDDTYCCYNNESETGCSDSTSSLITDEVDYYKSLICSLTHLKSVNVKTCSLKPVKKSSQAAWDKLQSLTDEFEEMFRPLWALSYNCDGVGIDPYTGYDIDIDDIDPSEYSSLFDLYYDIILASNNSNKAEDKSNGYILKNIANIRAIGYIISSRFIEYYD